MLTSCSSCWNSTVCSRKNNGQRCFSMTGATSEHEVTIGIQRARDRDFRQNWHANLIPSYSFPFAMNVCASLAMVVSDVKPKSWQWLSQHRDRMLLALPKLRLSPKEVCLQKISGLKITQFWPWTSWTYSWKSHVLGISSKIRSLWACIRLWRLWRRLRGQVLAWP